MEADRVIQLLGLEPHPEGGAFAETYRHPVTSNDRNLGTAIYFLLRAGQHSAWHRVAADELWFFHAGDPLALKQVTPDGRYHNARLGTNLLAGQRPQGLVPAGHWQAAVPQPGPHGWTLVGCVVVPGFDFRDFEMLDVPAMQARFPALGEVLAL